MVRLDYRMLAATLCALSACAHHVTHAHQPPRNSYDSPPAATDSMSPDRAAAQSRSGQSPVEAAQVESEPDAQTPPHEMSSGPRGPTHLAAAGPGISTGMPVQTESGSPLGFVVDVLPGSAGTEESGYVVIVGGSDSTTPVPYGAATSMVKNGSVVIDHARFAGAPKVKQSQIEDTAATAWKAKADTYWGEGGSADRPDGAGKQSEELPRSNPESDSDVDSDSEQDAVSDAPASPHPDE